MRRVLLRQGPQEVGQTGADCHFTAEQFHTVTRTRFQYQLVAPQPIAHFRHVILQGRTADKPFISQIFQFDRECRRKKTHDQVVNTLLAGARDAQHVRLLHLEGLIACRIINSELIAIAPAQDKLRAVPGQ